MSSGTQVDNQAVTEPGDSESVLARELEYHERLYSGFAQSHFARPALPRKKNNATKMP